MSSAARSSSRSVLFGCFLLAATAGSQSVRAQTIAGRVTDAASGAAIPGAQVTAARLGEAAAATIATNTNATGQFSLRLRTPGRAVITLSRIGYNTRVDTLDVPEAGLTQPFALEPAAVRVDSIAVETRRWQGSITRPATRAHLVSGSELLKLEEMGVSMEQAIRRLPGLRFRQVYFQRYGMRTCVEHIRRIMSLGRDGCESVILIIDDIATTDPAEVSDELKKLNISEMESVQVIPPHDAQIRFGLDGGSRGVIQMYRRGWGPYASPARNPRKQR